MNINQYGNINDNITASPESYEFNNISLGTLIL